MEPINLKLIQKKYKKRINDISEHKQNIERNYRKEIMKKEDIILFMKRYITQIGMAEHFNSYLKNEIKNIEKNIYIENMKDTDYYKALKELNSI